MKFLLWQLHFAGLFFYNNAYFLEELYSKYIASVDFLMIKTSNWMKLKERLVSLVLQNILITFSGFLLIHLN